MKVSELTGDKKEYYEFFHQYILKNARPLDFKMTENKAENFKNFIKAISKLDARKLDNFLFGIYKLYISLNREDEVFDFLDVEEMKIPKSKNAPFIQKFLQDFLCDENDEDIKAKTPTRLPEVAEEIYQIMERRLLGGKNCFYFDFNKVYKNELLGHFNLYLKANGYEMFKGVENLVFKKDLVEVNADEIDQEVLTEMYRDFVKDVKEIGTFSLTGPYVKTEYTKTRFSKIVEFKALMEDCMTEETKNSDAIKECMKEIEFLDDKHSREESLARITYEGLHGEEYLKIRKALKNIQKEESKAEIRNFMKLLKKVEIALSPMNDRIYPVNYFKITEMDPQFMRHLLSVANKIIDQEKKAFVEKIRTEIQEGREKRPPNIAINDFKSEFFDEDECEMIKNVNMKLGIAFGYSKKSIAYGELKVFKPTEEGIIDAVRYVMTITGFKKMSRRNHLNEEDLDKIPEEVCKVLKEEKLPLNVTCIKKVFEARMDGEEAVCLPCELRLEIKDREI